MFFQNCYILSWLHSSISLSKMILPRREFYCSEILKSRCLSAPFDFARRCCAYWFAARPFIVWHMVDSCLTCRDFIYLVIVRKWAWLFILFSEATTSWGSNSLWVSLSEWGIQHGADSKDTVLMTRRVVYVDVSRWRCILCVHLLTYYWQIFPF